MRKFLFFERIKGPNNSFFVTICKNKLLYYCGDFPVFDENTLGPEYDNRKRSKNVLLNSKFKIKKLDIHDQREGDFKATHLLICKNLIELLERKSFIQLNFFEASIIKWHLRGYAIQSEKMQIDLIKYAIGTSLGLLIGLLWNFVFN